MSRLSLRNRTTGSTFTGSLIQDWPPCFLVAPYGPQSGASRREKSAHVVRVARHQQEHARLLDCLLVAVELSPQRIGHRADVGRRQRNHDIDVQG